MYTGMECIHSIPIVRLCSLRHIAYYPWDVNGDPYGAFVAFSY